tara:strand:+ start:565 stop:1254 length:690 start_codon:yes stop_codon:yes gene_type:complete
MLPLDQPEPNEVYYPYNPLVFENLILTEIGEKAESETSEYYYWASGTYKHLECFRPGVKLRSVQDFVWQITAMLYLNPQLNIEDFTTIVKATLDPKNGICLSYVYTRSLGKDWGLRLATRVYNEKDTYNWDKGFNLPVRKRVVVFKDGVIPQRKSQIIGKLCHQPRLVPDMIEETMLLMMLQREKITVTGIARVVKFSRMQVNRVLIANPHLRDEQFKFNQLIKEDEKI